MKLNKIEKIIIAVILLGLILVGGTFIFVMPSFEKIGKESKTLVSNIAERAELETKLERLNTIDADIASNKQEAIKHEGGFYPDLTTYETSEIAMAYLKQSGLEAHAITIEPISTQELKLEYYKPEDVTYQLKSYSAAAKDDSDENKLVDGEFIDNKKKYTISVSSTASVTITDEEGNEIAPSKYTDTMQKMYKAAICKFVSQNNISQTVAFTRAVYSVKGKFSDYCKFIDHIYSLGRATMFESVTFPMTTTPEEKDEEGNDVLVVDESGRLSTAKDSGVDMIVVNDNTEIEQEVTLIFMSVEPMEALKTVEADGTNVVVDQRPAVY